MSDFILAVHGGAGALRPDLLGPDEETVARSELTEGLAAACERALARVLALGGRGGCVALDRGG